MRSLTCFYPLLILFPLFQLSAQSVDKCIEHLKVLSDSAELKKQGYIEQIKELETDKKDANSYSSQNIERQVAQLQSLLLQLKKAQIFTKNSSYSEALQVIQRLESQVTSSLTSDMALEGLISLTDELKALQENAHKEWYEQIDEVIEQARSTCLEAETAGDLDPLLLKVAALEMKRPSSSSNVLITRGSEKLRGTVSTLQSWMRYLDQRNAGNSKAANDVLSKLERSTSNFPLLSQDDLSSKWLVVREAEDDTQVAIEILASIDKPQDLAGAIQKFEVKSQNPKLSKNEYYKSQVIPMLIKYKSGFDALENGELESAESIVKSFKSYYGRSNLKAYFEILETRLTNDLVALKLERVTGNRIDPDKPIDVQIDAALEKLWEEQKVLEIKELLLLQPKKSNSKVAVGSAYNKSSAIDSYLNGKQFEKANDPVAAYLSYCNALRDTVSEHPLNKLAMDAISQVRASHPDRVQQFDESLITLEIQALREDLMRYNRSSHLRR